MSAGSWTSIRPGKAGKVALLAVVTALLAGIGACGTVDGQPQTVGNVSGLPITHFESGLKPDAPKPQGPVDGITNSKEDQLAAAGVADVEAYWTEHLPASFGGQQFTPVQRRLSYDSKGQEQTTGCGSTKKLVNAFYCPPDDSISWDRGQLLPMLLSRFGPMSVVTVLAHEYGHGVQYRLGSKAGIDKASSTIVKEQQADCFAGGYFRWVAEDKSKMFRMSTSEGLNQVMASMFFIRDQAGESADEKGAHGTAFDRTYAFQLGFEKGPTECAGINQQNVDARITEKKFENSKDKQQQGDTKIDQQVLTSTLQRSLDTAFHVNGPQAPKIATTGGNCPNGASTPPVSYCQDTNTVSVDLPTLAKLGEPVDQKAEQRGDNTGGMGDFAAFAEVASRYSQGVQKTAGAALTSDNAGLRTSCLVGAWAGAANMPGAQLRLSPGDLDEAIAELLQPRSLVAADVNGAQVASGFARVSSLSKGFLEGSPACSANYG